MATVGFKDQRDASQHARAKIAAQKGRLDAPMLSLTRKISVLRDEGVVTIETRPSSARGHTHRVTLTRKDLLEILLKMEGE